MVVIINDEIAMKSSPFGHFSVRVGSRLLEPLYGMTYIPPEERLFSFKGTTPNANRKRWGSSINTYGRDSDHLDQRPAKQQRQQHLSNGPAEILWTRLKQPEPRRTRRS